MNHIICVAPDCGDFHTITDALQSIPADNRIPTTIEISPGTYHEKLTVDKPFVTLLGTGSSNDMTIISYDDYALSLMDDGQKRGTFRTYTLFIDTHDITLRNLTIENASGDSKTHGQAIALYADGDRLIVDSCRLLGHQDTLFTGPLPPKELQPGGFLGPKRFAPRINGRHYYKNCYICGDIDFIFGSATAYFEDCIIESLPRESETIEGYTTAASTPEGQEYGYVFSNCRFTSAGCAPASVYLGRPWRNFAKTVLLQCELGAHIHPALFHDWGKSEAHSTVFFALYQCYPSNPSCTSDNCQPFSVTADFVCQLNASEAAHFSINSVLGGDDHWLCKTSEIV